MESKELIKEFELIQQRIKIVKNKMDNILKEVNKKLRILKNRKLGDFE